MRALKSNLLATTGEEGTEIRPKTFRTGRRDGKVYSTLLDWARNEPLNRGEVVPGYEESWAPLFRHARKHLQEATGRGLQDRAGIEQAAPRSRPPKARL